MQSAYPTLANTEQIAAITIVVPSRVGVCIFLHAQIGFVHQLS